MIRRAPNQLIYVSEKRYGLPLVIDPSTNEVIGQTGTLHGELADSFAIAFSSNAYGLKSKVDMAEEVDINKGTIVAGQNYR